MVALLERGHDLTLLLHLLGFALGAGAAFTGDVLLIKALHSPAGGWRAEGIRTTSQLIWLALALVTFSGLLLFLPRAVELLAAGRFLTKMVAVAVIAANGAFLQRVLTPRLEVLFISEQRTQFDSYTRRRFRRLAFSSGAVSATSWMTALLIGGLPEFTFPITTGLIGYASAIMLAVAVGLRLEARTARLLRSATREVVQGVAAELLDDMNAHQTLISRPKR